MMTRSLRAVLGVLLLSPAVAGAQDLKKLRLDLSVPDIPAFTGVDVTPSTISRPGNVKELAAALGNGLNKKGEVQTGLALEISPFKLGAVYLEEYVPKLTGPLMETYAWPLRVSLATNAVIQPNGTLTQVSAGARYSLFGYDPQADKGLRQCLASGLPPPPVLEEGAAVPLTEIAPAQEIPLEELERCRAAYRAAHIATTTLELAYAHAAASLNDPRALSLKTTNDSAWLTFSFGMNSFGPRLDELEKQFGNTIAAKLKEYEPYIKGAFGMEPIAHIRVDWRVVPGVDARQVDLTAAMRIPVRWDSGSVFLEGGVQLTDATSVLGPSAVKIPAGIGGEYRLNNGMWIGLYFGGNLRDLSILALSSLKFSYGEPRPLNSP